MLPIEFIEQVERGRCIVFAGPGISAPAADRLGPPGSALLALELATRLGSQLDNYSLPSCAQFYANRRGSHALKEYVSSRLSNAEYRPSAAQHVLARLPLPLIVCTAQDGLLLQAFQHNSVGVSGVLPDGTLNFSAERSVVLLYGVVSQPSTLRLTEDECWQVLRNESKLALSLRDRADSHTLLFVGHSLNDWYFREFYFSLRSKTGSDTPRAYFCLLYTSPSPRD